MVFLHVLVFFQIVFVRPFWRHLVDLGCHFGYWQILVRLYFLLFDNAARTTRGMGGAREVLEHFWSHLLDLGSDFGAHSISEGRSDGCFSMYLALTQKKTTFVYCNTKVGGAKYIEKH